MSVTNTEPALTGRPPLQRRRRSRRVERGSGFPWILPTLILSVGFIYYCVGYTGVISLYDWNGVGPTATPVGLANYSRLIRDDVVLLTLWHTGIYVAVTFIVEAVLGFAFAAMLHSNVRLGIVYKVLVFCPVIIAPAVMAPVFRQIYAADGALNELLGALNLGVFAQPWLAQSSTALGVIILIGIWERTGLYFILYYAAMSQVDHGTIEAAWLDGAGNIRVLWSIVRPSVAGTTIALFVLQAIYTLKLFDVPFLVSQGGPSFSTEFLGTYIYRQGITQAHVGYAAALSIALLAIALALTLGLNLRRRKEGSS
ncbi:carbohydrate ABC transporter permease [Georgenia deserti]|uniref:Carbohydrate ABC transporter permease n=1 Tax=Georgenia deserti TaxID=2093781 RepID=A0ABW4L2V3_9MICO